MPSDTAIYANMWHVMRDPCYWEDPDKFKPERFIDEFGNYKGDERNIPFMLGKRVCIGQVLNDTNGTTCSTSYRESTKKILCCRVWLAILCSCSLPAFFKDMNCGHPMDYCLNKSTLIPLWASSTIAPLMKWKLFQDPCKSKCCMKNEQKY